MEKIESLLSKKSEKLEHPLLNYLKSIDFDSVAVNIQRSQDILGYKPTKIYLIIENNEEKQPPVEYSWEDNLNQELIDYGVKSISIDNEKVRFSLYLRFKFKKAETSFGEGYFNAVLVKLVIDEYARESEEITDVMTDVFTNEPSTEGSSYFECSQLIEEVLSDCAKDLVNKLKYEPNEAMLILTGALALYLDERFSVSSRRKLGWT